MQSRSRESRMMVRAQVWKGGRDKVISVLPSGLIYTRRPRWVGDSQTNSASETRKLEGRGSRRRMEEDDNF